MGTPQVQNFQPLKGWIQEDVHLTALNCHEQDLLVVGQLDRCDFHVIFLDVVRLIFITHVDQVTKETFLIWLNDRRLEQNVCGIEFIEEIA